MRRLIVFERQSLLQSVEPSLKNIPEVEVQTDPTQLETILSDKVASQGKHVNSRDLGALNSMNIKKIFSQPNKEWWESL